jgi:hypothetical protein
MIVTFEYVVFFRCVMVVTVQLAPAVATYTVTSSAPAEFPVAPVNAASSTAKVFAVVQAGHTQYKVVEVRFPVLFSRESRSFGGHLHAGVESTTLSAVFRSVLWN